MKQSDLVQKYDVPVPRYTSYPTVPAWNSDAFGVGEWTESLGGWAARNSSKGIALYIHLPYCESLCTYCGCNKRITVNHAVELPYIQALLKEWHLYLRYFKEKPLIKEIHLGGGTPTFFSPDHLRMLIEGLIKTSRLDPNYEFSFEGHPNNTSYDHLKTLYDLGFRRVSYGIQDFDLKVQKAINRIQPYDRVEEVTRWAREIGYTSVNFDLIYGLPFQTMDGITTTMQHVKALRPDRIAFYSYAHVPWNSPGQRAYSEADLPKGEEKRLLNQHGQQLLKEIGYVALGMDHFALPNDDLTLAALNGEMKRNFMGYTVNNAPSTIGLGVSAITELDIGYAQNVKSVEGYQAHIKNDQLPVFRGHFATDSERKTKSLIMKIACTKRIPMASVSSLRGQAKVAFSEMVSEGLLERDCVDYRVTHKGTQFLRNICALFDEYYKPAESGRKFSQAV